MGSPAHNSHVVHFADFSLDLQTAELRRNGTKTVLQDQPFQLLTTLLESPGELVTREELIKKLWPNGTFVDFDQSLNKAVGRLREVLGDSAEQPRFIETLPRRGYRFIGPVTETRPIPPSRPTHVPNVLHSPTQSGQGKHLLSWYWWVVVAIGVVCLGLYLWLYTAKNVSSIQSVAVLPLENLSGDPSQEYLSDGITDEITTALARLSGPKVISRTSTMQYKGTHKSVPEIARELNVGAVVEGSLQRSGDQVRVRVQLIRGATDQHLWADEYDRNVSDVFGLESHIARDIAQHIQLQVSGKPRQELARIHPINPQAFQDYLQGRHYWALRNKDGVLKAIEYFERAIQQDPNDARSYAGLAHCYLVLPFLTDLSSSDAFDKAKDATGKALMLDASVPEAHLANAQILLYHDWNFPAAEKEFRQTLDLNPNYSTAHQWYAELLSLLGRHQEAIREENTALTLDPLSTIIHHELAGMLRDAGRYDEAIDVYRKTLKLNPQFYTAYWEMSWALRRQGNILESIHALQAGAEGIVQEYNLNPAVIPAINGLETAYSTGGRPGYFRQSLKVHAYNPRPSFYLARDHAQLGDLDAAIAELTRSYQKHDVEALWMFTDPELDPLRSDPRFQRLISAIGFPQKLGSARETGVGTNRSVDPQAFENYLDGITQTSTIDGVQNAIRYYSNAIQQQPDYAEAYTELARSYTHLGHTLALPPDQSFLKAKTAALKAIEIDEHLADAHAILGQVHLLYDWNFAEAEKELQRALELNPNNVSAFSRYAEMLAANGRHKDALEKIQRRLDLDPISAKSNAVASAFHFFARRYDDAIANADNVLAVNPNSYEAHLWKGLSLEQKHQFPLALFELKKAAELSNNKAWNAFIAHDLALSGDKTGARKMLRELDTASQHNYVSPWWQAMIYPDLGETDKAFFYLEKAYKGREHDLIFMNCWPMFDPLRSNPRFKDLERRIGLQS
jgi:TolB-like protein/DNA-binding winged helix-turn-helix (wHTH) protein/Tfp pilus assembly protein PilF